MSFVKDSNKTDPVKLNLFLLLINLQQKPRQSSILLIRTCVFIKRVEDI